MKTFNLKLNEEHLGVLDKLLGDAPYRVSAPIVQAINQQIAQQTQPVPEEPLSVPQDLA